MKTAACLLLTAVFFASGGATPQSPDFGGAWVATKDAPEGITMAPSAVFGARFWLLPFGASIKVIRPLRDTAVVVEHKLDGAEVVARVPGATCMGDATTYTTLQREGATLVHQTVGQMLPGGSRTPSSVRHTFKLTAPDTLTVESTARLAGQTEPTAVATVYKKSTDAPPAVAALPVAVAPATLSQVAWIAGTWVATSATQTIEERWSAAVGGAMHGVSRTVRGASLSAFEFLCIAERAGGLVYTAMPNARTPATDFFLTAVDATSAMFENPAHDFPKKIRYALREDGSLETTISGAATQKPTTFTFRKLVSPQ
jgi:Domain of unknown function (DUF6265)